MDSAREYQICTRCVMDTSDKEITFNKNGICNHCLVADKELPKYHFTPEQEKENLRRIKEKLLSNKKGEYDSILGLSGGIDSSYSAYLAWKMGLNPLCVHFDNGWNSNIALSNINKIIDKTGFDLYTYVINWPEFKDLQRSFFKAGVIDIEMLTDHAIFASLFRLGRKSKLKYVLSGTNYVTEHGMPFSWLWSKMDKKNILSIHKRFGTLQIKSFPTMGYLRWELMVRFNLGGVFIELLNNVNYGKHFAMEIIKREFDWEYYGGKHYESIFTKFYQAYILPEKFNVDKRIAHLSALIRSGEITREDAVLEVSKPLYDKDELKNDMSYILTKLDFSKEEFSKIMNNQPIPHDYYPNNQIFYTKLINLVR